METPEEINYFNESTKEISEKVKQLFGVDVKPEPITLKTPEKFDSFMRAYEAQASVQLTEKADKLYQSLKHQNIVKVEYSLTSWDSIKRFLDDTTSKLQKY